MGAAPDGADLVQGGAGLRRRRAYEERAKASCALSADGVADDGEKRRGRQHRAIGGGDPGRRRGADAIVGSTFVDAELSGFERQRPAHWRGRRYVLFGGDGSDTLNRQRRRRPCRRGPTGAGGDAIAGGPPSDAGADTFAGGPGLRHDRTTRPGSRRSARRSTAQPNDGEGGEADNVGADVEELIGGRGGDILDRQRTRAQRIIGGGGGDRIDPGAGPRRRSRGRRRTTSSPRRTAAASGSRAAWAPTR